MENHNIFMSQLPVQLREHVWHRHEWRIINLGSIGIPAGWVQHQDMRIEIRIELPMNWHQDDHFLGFGIFCVHHQLESFSLVLDLVFDEQCSFSDSLFVPSYCEYHGRHGSK